MKRVRLLDLKPQYAAIRTEIRAAMERVCEAQDFILGPEVKALEEELCAFCGARYAIGVSSGTDAILAALMAIGVAPGDEVVTTPYTFFATAGGIARLGARPVFADIEPGSFDMNGGQAIARIGPRTKAIVAVHLFGQCMDLEPIIEVARSRNIAVIEDAAQALGAYDERGRRAGTIGAIGCFSFFPSKNLGAFGDGGMTVTNDPELAETLAVLRVHGGKPKYYHQRIGGNFRLDALQAAILRVKLKYLQQWNQLRRQAAARYRRLFVEMGLLGCVMLPEDSPGHIYHQFVGRFPDRDRLQSFLRDRGIESAVYYPVPLHLQDCWRDLGYGRGDFPHAERAAAEALALPLYPELGEEDQAHVVAQIQEFYR